MKLKKIVAIFLACCICCTVLVLPASAQHRSNFSHFISDISSDWNLYKKGDISLSDFFNKFMSHATTEFAPNVVADIFCIKDVLHFLEKQGVDVSDYWNTYYNDMGGGGGGVNRDDTELGGYGAVLKCLSSTGNYFSVVYYGQKGFFYNYKKDSYGSQSVNFRFSYDKRVIYNSDGEISNVFDTPNSISATYYYDNPKYAFLGDWAYDDDSGETDGLITELPEKEIPSFDDDDFSDDDLIDFLGDLLNDLQMDFPDLSTIEGLLRAILAKLGTLDSDNDNELLSQILTAIEALKNSGETADNSELLKTLEELKNALVFKDGDKISSLAEMLNTLVQNQVRRSDITIDPKLYNQRYALIEAKLLGKFSFISEIKNFVQYAIDSYSNTENSPTITIDLFNNQHTIDFSMFDDSINLVRWLVAAFVYMSYAFATFRKIPGYINGGDNQ